MLSLQSELRRPPRHSQAGRDNDTESQPDQPTDLRMDIRVCQYESDDREPDDGGEQVNAQRSGLPLDHEVDDDRYVQQQEREERAEVHQRRQESNLADEKEPEDETHGRD